MVYVDHQVYGKDQIIQLSETEVASIMCTSLSDPQSSISMSSTGRTELDVVDHGCHVVDGEPPLAWNCSVSTHVEFAEEEFLVECKTMYRGKQYPAMQIFVQGE